MAITTRKREHDGDVEFKTQIDDLNDTLLELIFTRLSLWSELATCKCVSKRWKSIISKPDFTPQLLPQSYAFTLVQTNKKCPITEHPYFQKHKFSLDFLPRLPRRSRQYNIVSSNNDLIVAYAHINSNKGRYYVANPLTKQYIVVYVSLAKPVRNYRNIMVGFAGFVNGVSTVNVSHHNNHGFRIVHVLPNYRGDPKSSSIQIYSSETGQWKTYYLLDGFHSILKPGITWKNKIHWMYKSKIIVIDPFNIDNVAPRVVNLPNGIGFESIYHCTSILRVCQNRLCITQFELVSMYPEVERRIKLWEIDDYDDVNNYVAVKLAIDFLLEFPELKGYYYPGKMICCHPNDPQVIYFYYNYTFFYLNVVEQILKKVDYSHFVMIKSFVLVLPK